MRSGSCTVEVAELAWLRLGELDQLGTELVGTEGCTEAYGDSTAGNRRKSRRGS
jgi:hypothetical protein